MRFPQAAPHQLPARSGLTPHAQKPAQGHRLTDRWIATLQKARAQAAVKTPSKARNPSAAGSNHFFSTGTAISGVVLLAHGADQSATANMAALFALLMKAVEGALE